jgi:uncharacterized protein (DUF2267 family)
VTAHITTSHTDHDRVKSSRSQHALEGSFTMSITESHVATIDRTVNQTHQWLDEIALAGMMENQDAAWSALRGSLHALRDRMPMQEAVDLGAQLPTLIRGVYYEGWKPTATPTKERTEEAFLHAVGQRLGRADRVDPKHAAEAVFKCIDHRISDGELDDVRNMLPDDVRELWPKH